LGREGKVTGGGGWAVDALTYSGWVSYQQSVYKDHAYLAGVYAGLSYALAHRFEVEVDALDLHYRGYPSLQQWEATAVYANSLLPGFRLRAGGHTVRSEDPLTDGGWSVFGGCLYQGSARWEAGLDGYYSEYPDYLGGLTVGQIVPRFGLTFWRGARHRWFNELRGYWIGPSRDLGLGSNLWSVEDRLGLVCGPWLVSVYGWVGRQAFALRQDGFAAYNLLEDHRAGGGFEVRRDLSARLTLAVRLSREVFEEPGSPARCTADSVLAMLGLRF
jgi:hypothetical protein